MSEKIVKNSAINILLSKEWFFRFYRKINCLVWYILATNKIFK